MKKNYLRYTILRIVVATVLSCVMQHQTFCQATQQVTVDPQLIQNDSIPVTADKPVLRAFGAELSQQESYELGILTAAERSFIESKVDPPAIGVVRDLNSPVTFTVSRSDIPGQGSKTVSGGRLAKICNDTVSWTVMIRSAGADEIRLGFTEGNFPPGVSVNLFSKDGYAFLQKELHGQVSQYGFYTTTTFADYVILQVIIPVEAIEDVHFEIPKVVHVDARYLPDAPLTCYEDANCAYANGYADINWLRRSTAKINFVDGGGYYGCSGGLLTDVRGGDLQPFFLTHNH